MHVNVGALRVQNVNLIMKLTYSQELLESETLVKCTISGGSTYMYIILLSWSVILTNDVHVEYLVDNIYVYIGNRVYRVCGHSYGHTLCSFTSKLVPVLLRVQLYE